MKSPRIYDDVRRHQSNVRVKHLLGRQTEWKGDSQHQSEAQACQFTDLFNLGFGSLRNEATRRGSSATDVEPIHADNTAEKATIVFRINATCS